MLINWKEADQFYYKEWARWFAWYPVKIEQGKYAWLEFVERTDSDRWDDVIDWKYRRL